MVPILGSAVGLDGERRVLFAKEKARSHQTLFDALLHPLLPAQVAFLLLRLSAHPRFLFLRTLRRYLSSCASFDDMVTYCA